MSQSFPWKGHRYWLAVVFFLLAGVPGFWFPALSNILVENGYGGWKELAFMLPCFAGILSPLILGAAVDQRVEAQKMLGWIMITGAFFLYGAFHAIEHKWGGWLFLMFFGANALISVPAWTLINTVAMASLDDPSKKFGLYRVWGTIGWMMAGVLVSFCALDFSPMAGKIAAGVRIIAGLACFCLKPVKPQAGPPESLGEAMGFGAFRILKDRNHLVYFMTAFLFHIPLASFYLHTPMHLKDLGVLSVSGFMSTGQILEVVCMLLMGVVIAKVRVKWILGIAIALGVMRYSLCALGGARDQVGFIVLGVMLHGITWTFFVEAGRVFLHRRVDAGVRGQAQALMSLFTGGFAGITGVLTVKALHEHFVVWENGGWAGYWTVLASLAFLALVIFLIGYRSEKLVE